MKLRNIRHTLEAKYDCWLFKTKSGKKWQRVSKLDKFAFKLVALNIMTLATLGILVLLGSV